MTGRYFENPALDPTHPWEDSPETETELTLLISGIRKRVHEHWGVDVTQFLAALAESGTALAKEDEPVVAFVNKNATAFGYVPLIERHQGSCSVTPGAREPLRRALDRIARSAG
ncbi:hypothetical protein OU415_19060 [Saccharopolyspora sp. WRP15-2]|uniref:Uncharacterized protein n=1 Tax=Saccharopolyspora oryzae TaxID=2997343 RepID=A0ABT4V0R0_9PSEU|nr:hypothetical protein [Saccharopolyspora oryzae]MDA3627551.1 hypothetical protein [Saccharopolyspora oryzae]